jgi:isopenicillin N synthase-like dioxygenase
MNVLRVDYQASNAAELFTKTVRETGFGVLINHPIKEKDITEFYKAWEAFFLTSYKNKEFYLVDPKKQTGWVPPSISETAKGNPIRDIKEYFNFYNWGVCPVELREMTLSLYNQLFSVGLTLLEWIQKNTPEEVKTKFSEPLTDMVRSSKHNLFRVNYYPALTGNEEPGAVRAAAHEDIDLITVLTAGTNDGLQAMDVKGNWYDIPCEHGNLVINIGDMLKEASGGYFPSTKHQVLNPKGEGAKKSRMSCPLFIHPRGEVKLSERHTADSYLHERLVELGLRESGVQY